MKLISYIATLPGKLLNGPHATDRKFLTLTTFPLGVNAIGDVGSIETRMQYRPSDVAFMLGWVHEHGKQSPHLLFRKEIVDQQRTNNGRTIVADSNLFLYKNTKNPHYYLRYSYDGVFPDTGEYCDADPDPVRWQKIKQDIGLELQPWRTKGDHVLLCLQRNGGWSMDGVDVVDWAVETIMTLRQHTSRPIRIRPHPGDKRAQQHCQRIIDLCAISRIDQISLGMSGAGLIDDLRDCWAMVNHNSSPTIGAAIEGIPVFVTDPKRSQSADIANTDLSMIEHPDMPDRQHWVERLAQFHWSHEEIADGTAWTHMKKWAIL